MTAPAALAAQPAADAMDGNGPRSEAAGQDWVSLALLPPGRLLSLPDPEWASAVETLRWEGILPLVLRSARANEAWATAPGTRRAAVDRELAHYRAVAQVQEQELIRVLDLLAPLGVPPVLLKGSDLAYRYYPAPHLRPRSDADLLFRDLAVAEAAQARLVAAGYEAEGTGGADPWAMDNHLDALKNPATGCLVEIHGSLLFAPLDRRAPRVDRLLEGAEETKVLSRAVRVLSPEANLVYLMAHALGSRTGEAWRAQAFADVAQLLGRCGESLDWNKTCQLAEETRFAAELLHGLAGAREHFGAAVPPDIIQRLRQASAGALPPLSPEATVAREALAMLRNARGAWAACRLGFRLLFPSRAYMRANDPGHAGLPAPALYLRRWWRQALKLARLARESRGAPGRPRR